MTVHETPARPQRAHVVVMKIDADSIEDLAHAFEQIAFELRAGGLRSVAISGGASYGYTYEHRENETMSHDSYFAELEAYLAQQRRSA